MNTNFSKVARKSLMELTMFGEYGVSDKVGVCECVESLDDETVSVLAKSIMEAKTDQEIKEILEIVYYDELKKKNESLPILQESTWMKNRDNILMEADENKPMIAPGELYKIIINGGITAGVAWVVRQMMINPSNASKEMTNLRIVAGDKYEELAKSIRNFTKGKINFPSMTKTSKELIKLHNLKQQAAEKYPKDGYQDSLRKSIEYAKKRVMAAKKMDLKKSGKLLNMPVGRYAGWTLVAIMGTTGLAIAIQQIWQNFLSSSAKACRGKKGIEGSICILVHKIEGCDLAIKKWKEALNGCKEKNNPEKCIHSVQTQIWQWEKRKKKYQQKIERISKMSKQPPKISNEPEDQPSGGVFRAKA